MCVLRDLLHPLQAHLSDTGPGSGLRYLSIRCCPSSSLSRPPEPPIVCVDLKTLFGIELQQEAILHLHGIFNVGL